MGFLLLMGVATTAAILMQTTIFHVLPVPGFRPDLLLILCVYVGLHRHSIGGATAAFLIGYTSDAFSGSAIGLHAFAMSLVFMLVFLLSRRLWMNNALANLTVVFLSSIIKTITVAVLLAFYLSVDYSWSLFFTRIWADSLSVAVVTIPVFALLDGARGRWALE